MRQLAAAVSVISTGSNLTNRSGLTATAVCSMSAEPPRLLVCVNRTGVSHEQINRNGNFCVNVLASSQMNIARRFAGMEKTDYSERFAIGSWYQLQTGAPVLAGCMANFDCAVAQCIQAASHSIIVGAVESIVINGGTEPLAFVDGKFLTLATGCRSVDATLWGWS